MVHVNATYTNLIKFHESNGSFRSAQKIKIYIGIENNKKYVNILIGFVFLANSFLNVFTDGDLYDCR